MSSLGEIQQIHSMLQQIDKLLSEIDGKSTITEQKLQKVATQAIMINQILQRSITLFRRLGLPEDIDSAIYKIQRLISIMNQVRLAAIALYAGPGGVIIAGLSLLMVALDVGDLMMA